MLRKYGYDPEKFTIADDHKTIVPRDPIAEPTPSVSEGKPSPSTIGVLARGAAREAFPSAVGLAGAGLLAAGGGLTSPVTGPVGPIAGGLYGGYQGHKLGSELQEKLLESFPGVKEWMEEGRTEHPVAAEIGGLLPALATVRPGQSLRQLGNLPNLIRAQAVAGRADPARTAALLNAGVGLGAGALGAGSALYEGAQKGMTAEDIEKAGVRALAGAAMTSPNKLGELLSLGQFKATPEVVDQWAGARDVLNKTPIETGGALVRTPSWRWAGRGAQEYPGRQAFEEALMRRNLVEQRQLGAGRQPAGLLEAPPIEVETMPVSAPPEVPEAYRSERVRPYEPNFTIGGRKLLGAPAAEPAAAPAAEPTVAPKYGPDEWKWAMDKLDEHMLDPEFTKAKARKYINALKDNGLLDERDVRGIEPMFKNKDLQAEDILDEVRTNLNAKEAPAETFETKLANIKEGISKRQLRKVYDGLVKEGAFAERDLPALEESFADKDMSADDVIDFMRSRAVRTQQSSPMKQTTDEWDKLVKEVGEGYYGQKVETGLPSVTTPTGEEVAGKITLPKGLEQGLIQIAKRAGVDTGPHEILHGILQRVRAAGTTGEQRFADRLLKAAGGEENLVQGGGEEFIRRLSEREPALLKDLASFLKVRFLGRGTKADFDAIAANTLRYGAGVKGYGSVAPMQRVEGEQSLKKELANRVEAPVPEKIDTLEKQLELTLDKESTKAVTLFPHGSPEVKIPEGLVVVDVPQGKAAYNPAKVDEALVIEAGKQRQFDAKLLGMSKSTKPAVGENVVTTSKDGVKDVLTEVVAPGTEAEAVAAHAKAVPGGESEVRPANAVVEERYQRFGPTAVHGEDPNKPSTFEEFRANLGKAFLSPLNRMERDPQLRDVSDAFRRLFDMKDRMMGKYGSDLLRSMEKAKKPDIEEAYEAFIMRDKLNAAPPPLKTPEAQALYDKMDAVYRDMALDQRAAGQLIGGRARGVDPTGAFNMPSREVMEAMATPSPRRDQLINDFMQHNVPLVGPANAQKALERYTSSIGRETTPSNVVDFGAVSMPEGIKLPESWIDPDPFRAWRNYIDRFTRARAWHDVVEADPKVNKYFAGPDSLVRNPDVVEAFNSYRGNPGAGMRGFDKLGRFTVSSLVNVVSRLQDITTTPFKAAAYLPVFKMPGMLSELGAFSKHYNNAFENGFLRPGGETVTREILGANDAAVTWLDRATKVMSWPNEKLEQVARTAAQGFGDYIGRTQRALALGGDKDAIKLLDKLGSDWRTLSDSELGSRFGRLFQGHYDARNLPSWLTTSKLAPFFSLSKWSAEQYNNFQRFAIDPAVEGNYEPLMKFLAAHLVGGAAVAGVKEIVTGKKPYIAEIEEIKNAKDKNRAAQEAAYKLGHFVQITGMMGLPGDMMMEGLKSVTGKLGQGYSSPVLEVITDAGNRGAKALSAVMQGVPISKVGPQVAKDLLKRDVQLSQLARRFSKEQETSNKTRDLREYGRLSGRNDIVPADTVDYTRVVEREFDHEDDPKRARELGRELYADARQRFAGDPVGFARELRRLRNSRITWFPQDPLEQQRYMRFVSQTQGQEKARTLLQEYRQARQLQLRKRSMVAP